MKLSTAIRLGAMLHPQAFGTDRRFQSGIVVSTCALGAAEEAGFKHVEEKCASIPCPANSYSCCRMHSGSGMVAHLNDAHHWTRERIADWLESSGLDIDDGQPEPTPTPTRADLITA